MYRTMTTSRMRLRTGRALAEAKPRMLPGRMVGKLTQIFSRSRLLPELFPSPSDSD